MGKKNIYVHTHLPKHLYHTRYVQGTYKSPLKLFTSMYFNPAQAEDAKKDKKMSILGFVQIF